MAKKNSENQVVTMKSGSAGAISKSNLIEKLCFVSTGGGLLAEGTNLQQGLLDYNGERGDGLVSSMGIRLWFGKTKPGRRKAFQFISDFLQERVVYDSLSPDRKKVFNQLSSFLSANLKSLPDQSSTTEAPRRIGNGKSGAIIIEPYPISEQERSDILSTWQGTYLSFRARLIQDASNPKSASQPYSREVVKLTRVNTGLHYRHWHLRDGQDLSYFEGSVLISKDSLWMIGVDALNARYRICHFKRNESRNPQVQKIRWGLMHSDIPLASSHDPASVNIVWEKILVKEAAEVLAKTSVSYVGNDFGGHENSELLRKLVNGEWRYLPNIIKTNHLVLEKIIGAM